MRTIMVLNPKGGCGKSTIATNLASYYAAIEGMDVVLADLDVQGSSRQWLAVRPENRAPIRGIDAVEGTARLPRNADIVIYDAPAAAHGKRLADLVRRAQTLVVPVLPSPLDMRAAVDFTDEILDLKRIAEQEARVGIVANRAREFTRVYQDLESFLSKLRVPFLTTLRDTQNYIRAAESGLGIFELAPSAVAQDLDQWDPLLRWLRSKRSQPVHR